MGIDKLSYLRRCEDCGVELAVEHMSQTEYERADVPFLCDQCVEERSMAKADPGQVELAEAMADEIERPRNDRLHPIFQDIINQQFGL